MIRGLVDFSLNNRFLIVVIAVLLFAWGVVSFKQLPIEAYPDVANNYVQVITQWPGRAAEEVEQQDRNCGERVATPSLEAALWNEVAFPRLRRFQRQANIDREEIPQSR
jgi:hypothetical protein